MTTEIELTPEEVAELLRLTNRPDVVSAVRTAMDVYLRHARRQQLKSLSGHVVMQENWEELERAELGSTHEDSGPGPH